MIITAAPVDPQVSGDAAVRVLAAAQNARAAERAAAVDLLDAAVAWAELHPAASRDTAMVCPDTDQALGSRTVPMIEATAVAEFAAVALHAGIGAAWNLIDEALELRDRLPRLWSLLHTGGVSVWDARRVARATTTLPDPAAGYVDRTVVVSAGRVGPVLLDRLVAAARLRFDPAEAARRHAAQAELRRFDIAHPGTMDGYADQSCGLSRITGVLDLADALDLDAAVIAGAHHLHLIGDTSPIDVRRARAAGDLARHQPCLATSSEPDPADPPTPAETARADRAVRLAPTPRQITLVLHLAQQALIGDRCEGVGWVENTGAPVLADQVREWLGAPSTRVTVKPVVDLNQSMAVDGYAIPERIRERVTLRNPTCVFPWCARPAARCDLDHITPYRPGGPPGQTSTDNLAPLCRRHHRLKTFTRWRYCVYDRPGTYRWTSPYRTTYLVDPTGTTEIPTDP